jgi:hypothetical protein
MKLLLLILLLLSGKANNPPTDQFDLVEFNHFQSQDGHYDQLIFWDWSPDHRCYFVQAWMHIGKLENMPVESNGQWIVTRREATGEVRRIVCEGYRETWTAYDPERADKKKFDDKYRKGLKVIR